jgi:hypothetical protein
MPLRLRPPHRGHGSREQFIRLVQWFTWRAHHWQCWTDWPAVNDPAEGRAVDASSAVGHRWSPMVKNFGLTTLTDPSLATINQ